MKRFVKIICLVTSLLLISSCNKGAAPVKDAVDLNGYEFTWATPWAWVNYPEAGSSDYGDKRMTLYTEVEKAFNCKITKVEINPETYFDTVNKSVMAGDKFADFIEADFMRYQVMMKTQSLQPLNKIAGFDTTQPKFFTSVSSAYTSGTDIYGIQYQLPQLPVGQFCFFNKTLLENEQLESPYDLVKNGTWTFDKFSEMCKKLTKDTNSDNEIDQWGFATVDWHANVCEKPFIFANGGSIIKKDSDGKWRFALLDSPAQEALNYLYNLEFVDKVIKPAPDGSDVNANIADFNSGKVGFWIAGTDYFDAINANMEDELGIVPIPRGPKSTDFVQSDTQIRGWVMLISNKDADKASKIMNALSEPVTGSIEKDQKLYYDEFLTNKLNGDEKALEMFKLASTKVVPDNSFGVPGTDTLSGAIYASVRYGSVTPKAAMEAIGGIMQGYIEGFFYGPTDTTSSSDSAATSALITSSSSK